MQQLLINRAPIGVSLQDEGRKRFLCYGISAAGPMDWARHAMANRILDKPAGSTVIEIGPAGLGFELNQGTLQISFVGPRFSLMIEGRKLTGPVRTLIEAGQKLEIIPAAGAMWAYLGLGAELDLPLLLGSQAENSVSGLGVKSIRSGVRLGLSATGFVQPEFRRYIDPYISHEHRPVGILPSSQYEDFSTRMQESLVHKALTISARFDRMAYRLENVRLISEKGHDILSDGVTMGAIQVPGDGQPFILMADHQPTGGYPKIACVCKADLPRLAQMSPGRYFKLAWLGMDEAIQRWATINDQIANMTALSGTH